MEIDYMPGDVVPVTSSLYRVVHDPPGIGTQLQTFYAGQSFPLCAECGKKVRYALRCRVIIDEKHFDVSLRQKISN
jgi:hypothetical protein